MWLYQRGHASSSPARLDRSHQNAPIQSAAHDARSCAVAVSARSAGVWHGLVSITGSVEALAHARTIHACLHSLIALDTATVCLP